VRQHSLEDGILVSYSPVDPSTWSPLAASSFVVGLDVGMHADHSAFVLAGVWPQASDAIGVVDIRRFPLGTPLEHVADEVASVARDSRATVVVDSTNNSAFAGVLAARLPQPAVNWLIATAITSALSHAAQPTPMPIAIGGLKSAVRRWTLSKGELIETIAAELGNNSLRIARAGDWEVLQEELSTMERNVRASGSAFYSAPPGKHDDLVMALALCAFGCRRLGRQPARSSRPPRPRISSAAWT
jgi:hypothetical protein